MACAALLDLKRVCDSVGSAFIVSRLPSSCSSPSSS